MEERSNIKAKISRLRRVFLRGLTAHEIIFRMALDIKWMVRKLLSKFVKNRIPSALAPQEVQIRDPFKRFFRQAGILSLALFVVTSIGPVRVLETGFTADAFDGDTDFLEEGDELPYLFNEEGFILKPSPSSEEVNRIGFMDSVQHTVVSGDTLSGISNLYGISLKTLLWENNLSESNPLRIGQTLVIPPLDGVRHQVAGKETLASIAKAYSVDAALIKTHNNLEGDEIQKGQKLFIPGGKKKEPVIVFRAGSRSGRSAYVANTYDPKVYMGTDAGPRDGKPLQYPTNGQLTRGFRRGYHYGYDIANPGKPDVWAAAAGTVVKAAGGCPPRNVQRQMGCGSGYGNYIVIDHGNGLQTLYGHLETVYVSEGQLIGQGQAIGKMGNTGRSYGPTGIHVHFEVVDNGVKKNPGNYF